MIGGGLIFWFTKTNSLKDELFFGENLFRTERFLELYYTDYLIYLLKIRGAQLVFVAVFSRLGRKNAGLSLWALLTGCGLGFGFMAMLQRWGVRGLAGACMMMFPHYLFYFYAYGRYGNIDQYSQKYSAKGAQRRGNRTEKMAVLGVVIIGILLECYVNPFFGKLFIKIFL